MKTSLVLTAFLFSALAAHAAAPTPPPVITFEQTAITVTGLTAGGKLAIMSISRSPIMYGTETIDATRIIAVDSSGTARVEMRRQVPASTIVAAVDLETGVYSLAVPPGYRLRRLALPPNALRKKDDVFAQLGVNQGRINMLLVRPGKGAWRIATNDGSLRDDDRKANGSVSVNASALEPLDAKYGELKKFQNRDVMVIIDPNTMTIIATEVTE